MKTFEKLNLIVLFALLLLTGCSSEPQNFSYTYALESTQTYKITLSLNSDKHFAIEKRNIHFEQKEPYRAEGTLTDEEFARFKSLLGKSQLMKMSDSYGFEKETESSIGNIIYQIDYQVDGKEKFITIQNGETMAFPKPFTELLKVSNDFISSHVKE